MPIYEYRCESCERVSSVFVRSLRAEVQPSCDHCGGTELRRIMSRVQRTRTRQDVVDAYGTPGPGEAYRDPRQIGSWVEDRFREYGVDLPDDARDMIDRAREGDLPDEVRDL
ncbi:MAG: zinc ribbon domain-containing protein [Chloroflexi bacterium]|nr:zinc ribbon domain-containing protein [Chloroflexota bacterium]